MSAKSIKSRINELTKELNDSTVCGQRVQISVVQKRNGVALHGMTFVEKDPSPTVYLEQIVKSPDTTLAEIEASVNSILNEQVNVCLEINSIINNWRENIRIGVLSTKENKKYLKSAVKKPLLDLTAYLYLELDGASTVVRTEMLKSFDADRKTVFEQAMSNMLRVYRWSSILDIMQKIDEAQACGLPDVGMSVLTNDTRIFGAGCIANNDILASIADKLNSDLILLPSSVHEVIVLKANEDSSYSELSDMIKEINATQVQKEEVLAEHPYKFIRKTGCLVATF